MQSFYDTAGTGAIGLFDSLNRQAEALYEIPDSVKLVLDSLSNEIEEWSNALLLYDSIMAVDTSMSFAYAVESDSLQQLIMLHQNTPDSLLQLVNENRYARADSLQLIWNSISTTNSWQANEQLCLLVELHTLAKDSFNFNRSTEHDLLDLANKCPVKSGRGIIKARAMYSLVDDTLNYYDECTEADSTRRAMIKPENQKHPTLFNLFPNPTMDAATLSFTNVTQEFMEVKIYNMLGVLMSSNKVTSKEGVYHINTSRYSSGVYAIRVLADGLMLYMGQLIVTK